MEAGQCMKQVLISFVMWSIMLYMFQTFKMQLNDTIMVLAKNSWVKIYGVMTTFYPNPFIRHNKVAFGFAIEARITFMFIWLHYQLITSTSCVFPLVGYKLYSKTSYSRHSKKKDLFIKLWNSICGDAFRLLSIGSHLEKRRIIQLLYVRCSMINSTDL